MPYLADVGEVETGEVGEGVWNVPRDRRLFQLPTSGEMEALTTKGFSTVRGKERETDDSGDDGIIRD
jgi:hypothetical protein